MENLFFYINLWWQKNVSLLILILIICPAFSQSPRDISIIQKDNYYFINDVSIYSDKEKLPLDSVLKIDESLFRQNPNTKVYKASSSDRHNWFRFKLKNSSSDTISFKLVIGNNQINEMELFKLSENKAVSFGITGRLFPFSKRPYPFIHFTYPLMMMPNEEATFLYYADCRGISYRIMLVLFSDESFKTHEQRLYMFFGIFFGILLLSSLFNLFLYFNSREKVHLAYSLYSLFVILSLASLQSLEVQYLYPNNPHYTRTGISTYTSITSLLFLWVMQLFLKQTSENSRFFGLVNYLKWQCAAIPVLGFYAVNLSDSIILLKLYLNIYPLTIIMVFATVVACCIEKLRQGYKLALFYLAAVSCVIISGTIMLIGLINRHFYLTMPPNFLDISMVAEALIICFGILYRYILYKREKDVLAITLKQQQLEHSESLIALQESERKRIAEDLHDELGSSLAALKLRLQKSHLKEDDMTDILKVVDKASSDTRNISHNLMPPEFEKTSLNNLLSNYYSRLNSESAIRFNFHISGDTRNFSKEDELVIYRIIMELTSNILKHSGASEATIQLIHYANHLEIMAEDNGSGFESDTNDGIGLKNIQSRVNYLNGKLQMDNGAGGTTVMIQVPYKSK